MAIDFDPSVSRYGGNKTRGQLFKSVDWNALLADLTAALLAIGKDDGSTPGSLREAIAEGIGLSPAGFVWRPNPEGSVEGNVYPTWATLAEAIAEVPGEVRIFLEGSIETNTFPITAGAYPLACRRIVFDSAQRGQVTFANGVTFTGDSLRNFDIEGAALEWISTSNPLCIPSSDFAVTISRSGSLKSVSGSTVGMFLLEGSSVVSMIGGQCQIEAVDYAIFALGGSSVMSVIMDGPLNVIQGPWVRGPLGGDVTIVYDTNNGGITFENPAPAAYLGNYFLNDTSTSGRFNSCPADIATLQSDMTDVQSTLGSFGTALGDHESRLDAVEPTVSGHTSDIATLDGRLDTAEPEIDALQAGVVPSANIRNTTTAGPHTILAGETLVRQGYAGSMAYTMPPALVGTQIDIVKDTTNAGAITITRAGSDTIHGSASTYTLDGSTYVTSATTFRRRWTITCLVAGEWTVT